VDQGARRLHFAASDQEGRLFNFDRAIMHASTTELTGQTLGRGFANFQSALQVDDGPVQRALTADRNLVQCGVPLIAKSGETVWSGAARSGGAYHHMESGLVKFRTGIADDKWTLRLDAEREAGCTQDDCTTPDKLLVRAVYQVGVSAVFEKAVTAKLVGPVEPP
jgi:hypothetical protein